MEEIEEYETDEYEARDRRHEEEMRPVREAGGGEAEGFEETERELIEHATHGDPGPDPTHLAGAPEEYRGDEGGEADHEHSSEVFEDEKGDEDER